MTRLSDERLAEIRDKAVRTLGRPLVQWHSDVFALLAHIDALEAERADTRDEYGMADDYGIEWWSVAPTPDEALRAEPGGVLMHRRVWSSPWLHVQEDDR